MNNKKYVISHVISIVYTSLFLIISTYYWFNFKDRNYVTNYSNDNLITENITIDKLKKINDSKVNEIAPYTINILNNSLEKQKVRVCILSDILTDTISNNYVKYVVNDGSIHSLNTDGIVYINNLEANDYVNITIKLWISDTYSGNLNYTGKIIII